MSVLAKGFVDLVRPSLVPAARSITFQWFHYTMHHNLTFFFKCRRERFILGVLRSLSQCHDVAFQGELTRIVFELHALHQKNMYFLGNRNETLGSIPLHSFEISFVVLRAVMGQFLSQWKRVIVSSSPLSQKCISQYALNCSVPAELKKPKRWMLNCLTIE